MEHKHLDLRLFIFMNKKIDNLQGEIWKPIKNYEGYYEVSNFGRVKRVNRLVKHNWSKSSFFINEKIIKPTRKEWKDFYVSLEINRKRKNIKVKTLVILGFVREITNEETILNIDGDYTNNKLENLKIINKNLKTIPYKVGDKLKNLEIIQHIITETGKNRYLCKCVCGKEKIFPIKSIRRNEEINCGCMNYMMENHKNRKYDPQTSCLRNYYTTYKSSAKKGNKEFNLSFEDCLLVFKSNCYYCGEAPLKKNKVLPSDIKHNKNKYKSKNKDKFILIANGIDRIDSSKGYTLENIRPCCEQCNRMKLDYTEEEFLTKVKKIFKNLLK